MKMKINMMGLGLGSAFAINYLTLQHTLWAWIAFMTTAALSLWRFKSSTNNKYIHHHQHQHQHLRPPQPSPQTTSPEPKPDPDPDQQQSLPAAAAATSTSSSSSTTTFNCWLENRKSGKFRVYYCGQDAKDIDVDQHDDDIVEHNNNIATAIYGMKDIHLEEEEEERVVVVGRHHQEIIRRRRSKQLSRSISLISCHHVDGGWNSRELMKLKTDGGGGGDMDWYRHQDLTVLDGNVVRFWNN